jgi:hypothetical protein
VVSAVAPTMRRGLSRAVGLISSAEISDQPFLTLAKFMHGGLRSTKSLLCSMKISSSS